MSASSTPRTGHSIARLSAIAARGSDRAAAGLSDLLGREIDLDATGVHFGSASRLLDLIGGPAAPVAGIYLGMGPEVTGHVMLLFTIEEAQRLVDQLLDQARGTTVDLDEMACSALGEVGNITAAAFLNELGDAVGIPIHPTPPQVMQDLAGALLNSILAEVAALGGDVMVVETVFYEQAEQIRGFILITPDPASLQVILNRLQAAA